MNRITAVLESNLICCRLTICALCAIIRNDKVIKETF
nr:MAG TPA: hypothetical protein [Caudoviricetes sp.]